MSLHDRLHKDMREALRAGDKPRLGVLRMALAAVKQREVDTRATLDDGDVERLLERMIKQGRDALEQYRRGGREDLVAKEAYEIEVLGEYLPEALDDEQIEALVEEAITASGATGLRDLGRVMAWIKSHATGRIDMAGVSARVKARLGAG